LGGEIKKEKGSHRGKLALTQTEVQEIYSRSGISASYLCEEKDPSRVGGGGDKSTL